MSLSHVTLISKDAIARRREIALTEFPVRIGRSATSDVCVDDRWVSRDHCEVVCLDGQLVVRDLDSKYGTYVNGVRIIEKELHAGDELNIGLTRFVVQIKQPLKLSDLTEHVFA
jgi:pSer/pThr/pTyr-binding forkhead associated (FHA) protein